MRGPSLAKMAWRNLWRNRRRTLITLSSLAFGVLLATLSTGTADWRWTEVIGTAARASGGHVTIQHPAYLDTPSLAHTVHLGAVPRLGERPGVVALTARIAGQVLLATATQNAGAGFLALDPTVESPETFSYLDSVVEGEMFTSPDDKGIILGVKLAEILDTGLGRKVVYTMTDESGEIITGLARVRGILKTGAPTADARLCLFAIGAARKALGYDADEATQVAIFLDDHRRAEAFAAKLGAEIGNDDVAVLTWAQVQPDLAGFIAVKLYGLVIVEVFLMLLIAAGIFNTLFVSVMERLREFGILLAIGFSPARLFRLVLWESLWLGLVGVVTGLVITAWPYHYMSTTGLDLTASLGEEDLEVVGVAMDPMLKVAIYPENALAILVLIVGATLLSGLYPAWRAGTVVPVESIKLV